MTDQQLDHETAYQILNQLFEAGKLNGSQTAELRAIYARMEQDLKSTQGSEKKLINQAKEFLQKLEEQKSEIKKANGEEDTNEDSGLDDDSKIDKQKTFIVNKDKVSKSVASNNLNKESEVCILRNKLMRQMNELAIVEERSQEDNYTIEVLTEHRRLLRLEKERQPDAKLLAKQAQDLEIEIKLDEKYFDSIKKNITSSKERILELESGLKEQKILLETALESQDQVTAQMVATTNADGMHPAELTRYIDKSQKSKIKILSDYEKEKEVLTTVESLYNEKQCETRQLLDSFEILKKTFKDGSFKNENKERECAVLQTNMSREKLRENALQEKKEDLDTVSRRLDQEKICIHDNISKKKRELDKETRNLKKKQLQVNIIKDQCEQQNSLLESTKIEIDNFPKNEQEDKETKDLAIEVENLKKKKLIQDGKRNNAHENWESLIESESKLNKELEQEQSIFYEQGRMQHLKSDEREQKSRDKQRTVNRLKQIEAELLAKQHELVDHQKRIIELSQQQDQRAKSYEQIKNEKNKYVNLIQSASQKREELKEKLRILANEIEVLQQRLCGAEKELTKKQLKNVAAENQRAQCQSQINKARQNQLLLDEELGQSKVRFDKLKNQETQNKEEMIKLRKKYEQSVNSRNQRGVQLVEREEEVCVFHEKLNVQDNVIKKGEVSLQELTDEIAFLENQLKEERRQIDNLRKYRPELKALKNELIEQQIELSRYQDKTVHLEQKLESPSACKNRIRHLEGEDLTPDKLETKLAQLELRLAQKEEQSLEKSLIYEQVDRLLNKLQGQQTCAHDDKKIFAEQCAESKAQLDELHRKSLAIISEIAMERSNNILLQDKVKDLATMSQICKDRFNQGKPPNEEMLEEWKKYIRNQKRKQEERVKEHAQFLELQKHILPNGGGITTAEPRPNAYLVEENFSNLSKESCSGNSSYSQRNLPVPKPYGSMGPFKPQPAGATMRHIKKPTAKPLEI